MTAHSVNRKLTAILSADVKGYSRLMGDDEVQTVTTLTAYREVFASMVRQHRGRVVDSPGDAILTEFGSVVEAVRCAIGIQAELAKRNSALPLNRRMDFRIGVNLGDVIEDGDRIYGDGINIAARIESLAEGGGLCISRTVYDQVKKKLPLKYDYMGAFEVKNINEPVRVYKVTLQRGQTPDQITPSGGEMAPAGIAITRGSPGRTAAPGTQEQEEIFYLEFHAEGERIQVRSHEGRGSEQSTLKQYEDSQISFRKAEDYAQRIKDLLSKANKSGRVGKDIITSLKQTGHLLYDELIPAKTRESLNRTRARTLVLSIDDRLVHFPWELVCDGKEFLCQRFNMGRVVSTRQAFAAEQREVRSPLSMLILSDPQGNLPDSYNEGIKLRDLLDHSDKPVEVSLKSSNVTLDFVKGKLRFYDVLHYAGHADYNVQDPGESGFLFNDGKLRAREIRNMVGRMPFPAFVFSNACQSGQTDKWNVEEGYENVYGLANAFLLSGVRHYLGTFWEVQDEPSLYFALAFYGELIKGSMIGEAVRKARLGLVEKYGEDTVIWASYMLYGDPTFRYAFPAESGAEQRVPVKEMPEAVTTGAVRGGEHVVEFAGGPRRWAVMGATLLAVLVAASALVITLRREERPLTSTPVQMVALQAPSMDEKERAEDMRRLVSELAERYRTGESRPSPSLDDWTTRSNSVVFLNVGGNGIIDLDREVILGQVTADLIHSGRVRVVERDIINKLLEELNLGTGALVDPATALRLGRVVSARYMVTGSVLRDGDDWMVNLRLVETDTTSIKAAITASTTTSDRKVVSEVIGSKLLESLVPDHPLKARVTAHIDSQVTLNIGAESGLAEGMRMEVLSENATRVAELETVKVGRVNAKARVVSGGENLKSGQRVRQLL